MDDQVIKIQKFLDSLDGSIDDLHTKLQPIITKSLDEVVSNVDSPIEKIEIYNSYSYVLISIVVAYLRSKGVDTAGHPVMKELDRVKSYMKRYKDLVSSQNTSQQKNLDETKEYLQQTLGNKSVTGNTITQSMSGPAISSNSFKNTHKKFTD
ncbi:hypothetical protein PSN45_001797 [Yamadazyma tenuis]|uniref:Exosome complex protein n=1 Tax=Candida tenuis (strain ATCC 10573 / BCRC 21748 / CBS 615 / JCM 9827 / NBRC 10315 / NRRL Y-1498 / VKM Y-70) TaxID=590646 RepID=G3BE29_CANTC|nr:uncharacterized protein CANTEDRAFT_95891 [Yamadazyma tenuis ATCC 10573]EGV60444.1 hypothetical protein CANTEDRAFT_95891 [Yamadazyma tenuis ATCC 10573]WEJ94313.1 hypothetical protein PSN45_001797 [Yamadazyma tenuis]